jgi:DNA-binding protein HU-beta
MNRRELITAIAAHSDAEPNTVDAVLRGFTDVVCATVAKGDPVVLTGFAKFAKIQTKARMGRNPATGEAIKIKASKKARITPLKGFKDIVLGAAPAPKLTKPSPAKPSPAKRAPAKPASKAPAGTAAARTTAAKAPAARARTTKATKAPATRARATKATTARTGPARSTAKR